MAREKDTYLNKEGLEYYHNKVKREFATKDELQQGLAGKQDVLTSENAGTGIDISIGQGGKVVISNTNVSAEWGNIQGDITDQTDLVEYVNEHGGGYSATNGIVINNKVIALAEDLVLDCGTSVINV